MVFAARVATAEMAGIPKMVVHGLADKDARALFGSVVPGPVDPLVHDEIVAKARGNPLALLELPRGITATRLAGGFGLPGAVGIPGTVEASFRDPRGHSPRRKGACCCWPPPNRSETGRCYGEPPAGWGSVLPPSRYPRRP